MTGTTSEYVIGQLSRFFDALEHEDMAEVETILEEIVDPRCEFTSQIGTELDGRTYSGPRGIRDWFEELSATMTLRYEGKKFRPLGEHVVLGLMTFKGTGRGSGVEVDREIGVVWEFENGLCIRAKSFGDQAEAIAAAEALDA